MKKGSGKKGGKFERLICKQLSLWLTDNKNANVLWRSATSGGRSTVLRKKGEIIGYQAGDISAVSTEGYTFVDRVYTECKHYKYIGLERYVANMPSFIGRIWEKTQKEARSYDKFALLVIKQNTLPTLVVFNNTMLPLLLGGVLPGNLMWIHEDSIIMRLDNFIGNFKFEYR